MLRGHFGSVELIRGIFNPSFRRNLSAASIRYAEDKNRKKPDGVFSWLKDIFKADDGIQEARKVTIDRGPVTVLDYPETNQACLTNFKLDHVDNQGSIEDSTSFHDNSNYINYEQRRQFPRHDLLTLSEKIDTSIRTIMGCTPGNTKPPIREPNMPEKQEKKDDKKEKKKKKPVIRMEGGLGDNDQNDPTVKAEGNLHDNLDVNLSNQWGVRLPEEMEKSQNAEVQRSVGSGFQIPVFDTKDMHVTMSSKDSDKIMDAKTKGQIKNEETAGLNDARQVGNVSESSKKILNASSSMMGETNVVDEDYNIPSGANVDAEVSAWKELVLRSKIPLDPTKEEFIPQDGRQAEMLSIRPEPPRPKLDVQAVPTSNDQTMEEEDDETEFSPDVVRTGFKSDTARTGTPADVQKLDNKKLHTGSVRFIRRGVGFFASQRTLDFSTSTDSGWGRTDQISSKEPEQPRDTEETQSEDRLDQRSSNMEVADNLPDNEGHQETLSNFEEQKQTRMEQDFRDSLNSIADREMEMSMSSSYDEDQNMLDERHAENEQFRSLSDDFQASFDYASSPYENDFYPGYESMSLEPDAEKSTTEKSKESSKRKESIVASSNEENDEGFVNPVEEYRDEEYVSDENYIRIPGDPYPYSREHFYKWTGFENKDTVKSPKLIDIQPSVPNLHNDVHTSTLDETQKTQDRKGNEGSATAETTKPNDGIGVSEGSKKLAKSKDDSGTHVETIQPDIHLLNQGVDTNVSQRNRKKEPSSLIQEPKVVSEENQKGLLLEDIHALRNKQLSTVSKDEIEKIYELKNYAYLRAEEMKNLQLNLKSKLPTSEQEASVTKQN